MSTIGTISTSNISFDTSNAFEDSDYSTNPFKASKEIEKIIRHLNSTISFVNRALMLDALEEVFMESFKDNWDDEGAKKISLGTYELAKKFIESLPLNVPNPYVMPMINGKIGFEWRSKFKRIALITIGDDKNLIFTSNIEGRRFIISDSFKGSAIPQIDEQLTDYFKE